MFLSPRLKKHADSKCRRFTALFLAFSFLLALSGSRLLIRTKADDTAQSVPFVQDWTNTGLIKDDDDWSGVPGIVGFRGDNLTSATGADPQSILADGANTPVDVNANQTNPDAFITGGVAEFEIENPIIALQGSGTADAPHIVINLNTIGFFNINLSYNLRDIDGSADNAVQPVALQYRIGQSGNFINLPAGFVADATTGPNAADLVTPVSVALPTEVDKQPLVQLRIITTNAVGNDEWVGIDDINITGQSTGGLPLLAIDDVTIAEGNEGTTTANFTVSLSAPAGEGGVTFDIATQCGTATAADNDYIEQSLTAQTMSEGDQSYTFSVAINGDINQEPDENFFVNVTNVSGAIATDAQGHGTIVNDDFSLLPIHAIQGDGPASPHAGSIVATSGIVTLLKTNGFFIQTPDASVDDNRNTSEGIFVFTAQTPTVNIGDALSLTGMIVEFNGLTEIGVPFNITIESSGHELPTAITLTPEILNPDGPLDQLERFEGMRLYADSLTTVSPSDDFRDFYTILTSTPRPFREPGIEITAPLPPGAPGEVPRFDENPERIVVDSNGRFGSSGVVVTSGVVITSVCGPLDYSFGEYRLIPDAPLNLTENLSAAPVPAPEANEFTVGSFNVLNFFNNETFPAKLDKISLAIRNVMRSPDIIGLQEVADINVLQALAEKINSDAVEAGESDPQYVGYLIEADEGGDDIDIGLLVKASRVNVMSVVQEGRDATFINPTTGRPELTHDRPPLVLCASINRSDGGAVSFTLIVNHLRSLLGIDSPTEGPRVRAKRQAQAEFLANLIQQYQTQDPAANIISVGDYNSFQFNDGYVDTIGTILGRPAPPEQVVLPSPDVVEPDLYDLIEELPAEERYTYVFEGNAQVLDHIIVNHHARSIFTRIAIAHSNSDFPRALASNRTRPERASDHDMPVAYFNLAGMCHLGKARADELRAKF